MEKRASGTSGGRPNPYRKSPSRRRARRQLLPTPVLPSQPRSSSSLFFAALGCCFEFADYLSLTFSIQSIESLRRRDSSTVPTTQSSLRRIRSPSSCHRTRYAHFHSSWSQSFAEEEVRSLGKRSGFPSCSFSLPLFSKVSTSAESFPLSFSISI